MEIMGLYKTNKVNPITGCLPLLIQLPFLIAMFDLLKSSFLLRGASFIPGWIDNLTAPDVLFSWQTSIWFIGNEFHLLPILLGIVMFLQQKVTSLHKKGPVTDQQKQQQVMGNMMAILFTAMFYNFPSGLNIYWLSSMILGVVQQWITNKILDSKHLKNEVVLNNKKHR
ncbi:Inner membrane protein translocase component YidC [Chlamydia pneumoniae B21]|nr:Inner membrane protein translocase component YidC [Chlamydia pneumoniae B21]